jgi:hypothetical protein
VLVEAKTEAEKQPGANKLAERRREAVVQQLSQNRVKDAAERTQISPLAGEWYPRVLQVVRVLVFAPLALFLVLQALVILARPAAK